MSDKQGITLTKKQLVMIAAAVLLLIVGGVVLGLNLSKKSLKLSRQPLRCRQAARAV